MKEFIFGTFTYEYQLITQERKTLSLTVTPDLHIILKCPESTEVERIEKFLRKKWFWLEKQLKFFKKYQTKIYEREYISGESYLYLGRQYKLVVKTSDKNSVTFAKGQLIVCTKKATSNISHNKQLIDTWFSERADTIFGERFLEMLKRFDYEKAPVLKIREMKKRWGSFLNKEKIFLNPKLIHTSKECIDYVIVHELCHFKHKDHSKKFWKYLELKYPKWKPIKDRLELMGVRIK
jgi:predicted metal-dependent hydrolase